MDEDSHTVKRVTHRFVRGLGIGGLAIVASLGLTGRVRATYLHLDCAPTYAERYNAGDYIDRRRYHYLDKGRYYYLDRGQYNLLGGLGYSFGRPHYQRQYDWGFYQSGGQSPIPEPSTIVFLGLGALVVLDSKRHRKERKK